VRAIAEALALGLVVAVGVDSRLANELTVFGREGHDVIEHVETDRLTSIDPADVEVTEPAQVAQRDVTVRVDSVGANAPVGLVDERVRLGFDAIVLGDTRRAPTEQGFIVLVIVVACYVTVRSMLALGYGVLSPT
jgi:hypothetical protein